MERSLLEEVYQNYSNELYLYLYSFCRNRAAAEDLLQEVFLKALISLDNTHQNFRAWLYLVGRNLCMNYLKRNREVPTDEGDLKCEASLELSPLERILSKERNRLLYSAVLQLSEISRQAILLQYFSRLPQREIAEVLGISQGNVRIIIHRAKKELKKQMEVKGYEFSGDF